MLTENNISKRMISIWKNRTDKQKRNIYNKMVLTRRKNKSFVHSKKNKRKISNTMKKRWEENRPLTSKNRNNKISLRLRERYKNKENHPLFGKRRPKEIVDKIAKSNTGKKRTKEFSDKMRKKQIEYFKNVTHKEHLSRIMRNMRHTEESKKKISRTQNNSHWQKTIGKMKKKKISAFLQGVDLLNWHGFISFEPYDELFNSSFKKKIKAKYNNICVLCGEKNNHLDIHHINYNKKDTSFLNCIPLCKRCHGKTMLNRVYWERILSNIVIK